MTFTDCLQTADNDRKGSGNNKKCTLVQLSLLMKFFVYELMDRQVRRPQCPLSDVFRRPECNISFRYFSVLCPICLFVLLKCVLVTV